MFPGIAILGEYSTWAVGKVLNAAPSALPEGDSLTLHRRPYTGGDAVPVRLSTTFHPDSVSDRAISSAKRPASKSPSFVTSTLDPGYGLRAATRSRCCAGLIRRAASLSSILSLAVRSSSAFLFASAARCPASAARSFDCPICDRSSNSSALLIAWSFRLFHQCLIPKIDSPAMPTSTITPKTNNQMSIFPSNASSSSFPTESLSDAGAGPLTLLYFAPPAMCAM